MRAALSRTAQFPTRFCPYKVRSMHIFKFSCGSTILCTLHVVLYAGVSTRLLISTAAAMQVGSLQHTRITLMLLLHPRFCQVLSISTQLQCCYLVQSINLLCTTLVFATVLHSAPLLHSCSDASRQPVKHMMKPLLAVAPPDSCQILSV